MTLKRRCLDVVMTSGRLNDV